MSEIRVNTITDEAGTGSPSFPNGIAVANTSITAVVTESSGIASNDNDTTIPTSAAVKEYADATVLTTTAGASAGAVGTYAFLSPTSTSTIYDPGDTLAGSSLRWSSAEGGGLSIGTAPSGTWQLNGYKDATTVTASLWLRIS
jgi:hypothetical protein